MDKAKKTKILQELANLKPITIEGNQAKKPKYSLNSNNTNSNTNTMMMIIEI